jgi:uncharacterized damage-inducible protein DinB
MTTSLMADAFGHHVWATTTLLDACLTLDDSQLATDVPGTYGSILAIARHTVGADHGYLFALTGGAHPEVDEDSMSLAELRASMEANGPEWAALLATNPDPGADVVRHRDDGTDSHAQVGIRLAQALHHGTDHRSQICTALTVLGVTPPEIDVWDYAWKDQRIWEEPTPA